MGAGQFVDPRVGGQFAQQTRREGWQDELVTATKNNEQRGPGPRGGLVGGLHQQGQAIERMDRRTVQGEGIEIHPPQGLEVVACNPVTGNGRSVERPVRGQEIKTAQNALPGLTDIERRRGKQDRAADMGRVCRRQKQGYGAAHAFSHDVNGCVGIAGVQPEHLFAGVLHQSGRAAPFTPVGSSAKAPDVRRGERKALGREDRCGELPGIPAVAVTVQGQDDTAGTGCEGRIQSQGNMGAIRHVECECRGDEGRFLCCRMQVRNMGCRAAL